MNSINNLLKIGSNILIKVGIDNPVLEAKIFLCQALKKEDYYIYAHPEELVPEDKEELYYSFISRREKKEPVAYIIEKKEFMGRDFYVNKNVLIPRGDTEILVDEVLKILNDNDEILEVGVGSGCISISLIKEKENVTIKGIDNSKEALLTAEKNAILHNVGNKINFVKSDLFENVEGMFDVIVSNPPYISNADYEELETDVKAYEPKEALVGGEDGNYFYKKIIKEGQLFLKENGYFAFEIGYNQAQDVIKILKNNEFNDIRLIKDYAGLDRVVIAKRS